MKNFFLFLIFIAFSSCGKGNHIVGKALDHTPRVGVNDPCSEANRCQYLEYLSLNDPLILNKFQKYFPDYKPNNPVLDQYEIGQKYSLNQQGYFNQEYDSETGVFKEGCIINYDETRTVYKTTPKLIDEDGEEYSEIVFLYKKENAKNLTPTKECEDFLADSWDFDDEDWDSKRFYITESNESNSTFELLKTLKKDKNMDFHFYIISIDGVVYLKKVFDIKNQEFETEINNEQRKFIVDRFSITISLPDENTLGNKYEYTKTFVDSHLVEESSLNLSNLEIVEVDPGQVPEEY